MPDSPPAITDSFSPSMPADPMAVRGSYSPSAPSAPVVLTSAFSPSAPSAPVVLTSAFSPSAPSAPVVLTSSFSPSAPAAPLAISASYSGATPSSLVTVADDGGDREPDDPAQITPLPWARYITALPVMTPPQLDGLRLTQVTGSNSFGRAIWSTTGADVATRGIWAKAFYDGTTWRFHVFVDGRLGVQYLCPITTSFSSPTACPSWNFDQMEADLGPLWNGADTANFWFLTDAGSAVLRPVLMLSNTTQLFDTLDLFQVTELNACPAYSDDAENPPWLFYEPSENGWVLQVPGDTEQWIFRDAEARTPFEISCIGVPLGSGLKGNVKLRATGTPDPVIITP